MPGPGIWIGGEKAEVIEPHGGHPINRLASGEKAVAPEAEARELPVIQCNFFGVFGLEMLAIGAFSPLEGLMGRADSAHVMLSGMQVRSVLLEGGHLPPEFTRPERAAAMHQAFERQQIHQGAPWS